MIVRINGRIIEPMPFSVPVLVNVPEVLGTVIPRKSNTGIFFTVLKDFIESVGKYVPPGALFAAIPVTGGGLITKLWPMIDKLQEFGLVAGIGMSLWGLCIIILGDPSGKSKIWQAVVGFIGLFVIPEVFFAIYQVFKGGS